MRRVTSTVTYFAIVTQRRAVISRLLTTLVFALLCACGMGPQSGQTLRTFARDVQANGRGYSGNLRRADADALQDLGICWDSLDRVRTGFGSGPMVMGGAPMLGVTRGEVQDALRGRHALYRGPYVWYPCPTPAAGTVRADGASGSASSNVVAAQLRFGALRIELVAVVLRAGMRTKAELRVIGAGLSHCEWMTLHDGTTGFEVALSGSAARPTVRLGTLDFAGLGALGQATVVEVCGVVHTLDATERARLQAFATQTRPILTPNAMLPDRDTTADGGLQRDILSFLELASRYERRGAGRLRGVASMIIDWSEPVATELWRIDGDNGPLRYVVTLTPNPGGGTDLQVAPEGAHQELVVEAGRNAIGRHEYRRAAAILRPPAERGNAVAQVALGVMHLNGWGMQRSPERAAALFSKAAEQGNAKAEFNLALLYDQGNGVPHRADEALAWAHRAADHGHLQALSFIGSFYAEGEVVAQDWAQAEGWYRRAAERGDPEGCRRLGLMYAEGQGVTQDRTIALQWYRRSADTGWPLGLVALGRAYEDGLAGAPDYRAAREWYEQAHAAGSLDGTFRLGVLLLNGQGGASDEIQGRALITKAAEGGHEAARAFLAPQAAPQ